MTTPVNPEPTNDTTKSRARTGWRNWGDHPLVAVVTVLASIVAILQFVRSSNAGTQSSVVPRPQEKAPAVSTNRCSEAAGRWDWLTTGGVVAIAAEGTIVWYRTAGDVLPTITGTWDCDPGHPRHFTFRWLQTGLVDSLMLSADGTQMTGANIKSGFKLSGTRAR